MVIPNKIRRSPQSILKEYAAFGDLKNLDGSHVAIPLKPDMMMRPDKKLPRPKDKAYRPPSSGPFDISAISSNKAARGAQG